MPTMTRGLTRGFEGSEGELAWGRGGAMEGKDGEWEKKMIDDLLWVFNLYITIYVHLPNTLYF